MDKSIEQLATELADALNPEQRQGAFERIRDALRALPALPQDIQVHDDEIVIESGDATEWTQITPGQVAKRHQEYRRDYTMREQDVVAEIIAAFARNLAELRALPALAEIVGQ